MNLEPRTVNFEPRTQPEVAGCSRFKVRRSRFEVSPALFLSVLSLTAVAADLTPSQVQFFESKIRPLLADNCYKCHSQQAEKLKGGLLLDTREGVLKGGDTGPAIVPGDPEKSLLIEAVRYTNPDLQIRHSITRDHNWPCGQRRLDMGLSRYWWR